MAISATTVINLALKDIGALAANQQLSAQSTEVQDAFQTLNEIVSQWNRKRWLIYELQTLSITCTGAQGYTIGPSPPAPATPTDFPVAVRPNKIESAFFRQMNVGPNQPDYPLQMIAAKEDYNRLSLKNLTAFPQYYFYDTTFPIGTIYPWPIPQANLYALFISFKTALSSFISSSASVVLPPEYEAALRYNLAVRLAVLYRLAPDQMIMALAEDALQTIRVGNTQIPRLAMPQELVRRGTYDIYSDRGG